MQKNYLVLSALLVFTVALWGCGRGSTNPVNSAPPSGADHHDHADHHDGDHAANEAADGDVAAAFATLSSADRALAEKQKICPVSGEALGAMGAPIKVDVNGQPVFICCEGCKEDLLAKPEEYLAKLNK